MDVIPTSAPVIGESEVQAVVDVLESTEVSGLSGSRIVEFEALFSEFCGSPFGVATSSGTSALHLAMNSLGIQPGDEVLVATLTNMATFFSVLYQGGTPIPVDVEPETGNLDPELLEASLTDRTVGVIVVHLFGHPADMKPVLEFCSKHSLWLVEDAAEAHGAEYEGSRVGSLGDIGCFSFFANKLITTGEGGMLVTSQEAFAQRARQFRSLAFGNLEKFQHAGVGFNYRMTNMQAALGVAQMRRLERNIIDKRSIAARYQQNLGAVPGIRLPIERDNVKNVYWMYHVVLEQDFEGHREQIREGLRQVGIETRESFVPFDEQTIFIEAGLVQRGTCPVAAYIGENGFYLPSGPRLSDSEVDWICENLLSVMQKQ